MAGIAAGTYTYVRGAALPPEVQPYAGGDDADPCSWFWRTFDYSTDASCPQWAPEGTGRIGILIVSIDPATEGCEPDVEPETPYDRARLLVGFCYDFEAEEYVYKTSKCEPYHCCDPQLSPIQFNEPLGCCCPEGVEVDCCPDYLVPQELTATITFDPLCGCPDTSVTLTYETSGTYAGKWTTYDSICGSTSISGAPSMYLYSVGTGGPYCWALFTAGEGGDPSTGASTEACDPLEIHFNVTPFPSCSANGVTAAVTITE